MTLWYHDGRRQWLKESFNSKTVGSGGMSKDIAGKDSYQKEVVLQHMIRLFYTMNDLMGNIVDLYKVCR